MEKAKRKKKRKKKIWEPNPLGVLPYARAIRGGSHCRCIILSLPKFPSAPRFLPLSYQDLNFRKGRNILEEKSLVEFELESFIPKKICDESPKT